LRALAGMSSSSGRRETPSARGLRAAPAWPRYTPIRACCEGKLGSVNLLIHLSFIRHCRRCLRGRTATLAANGTKACQHDKPRSSLSPEGMEGGAGRPGSRPLATDQSPVGARRTPCPVASAPLPGAWKASHRPSRSRRSTFAASGPWYRRSDGLSANRPRHRTAAPGSCAETRPCRRTAIPSPRHADYSRAPPGSH
jgi:hypothetical protein